MPLGIVGNAGLGSSGKWRKGGNSGSFGISNSGSSGSSGFGNSGSGGNLGNSGLGSSGNVTSRSCRASTRIVWLFISDKLLITKSGKNRKINNGKLWLAMVVDMAMALREESPRLLAITGWIFIDVGGGEGWVGRKICALVVQLLTYDVGLHWYNISAFKYPLEIWWNLIHIGLTSSSSSPGASSNQIQCIVHVTLLLHDLDLEYLDSPARLVR